MFKLNEEYDTIRNILKCDYIRYSPSEISTINTANCRIYINTLREVSVISVLNSHIDLNFDVFHAASKDRYADGNDIRLVIFGGIASFSKYKLTTSSEKHLEDLSHAHIVCLMYKLITSAGDSDDLLIGFDRDRNRRQREFTYNKKLKGKYHIRIMFRDVFGFAEYQEKATYGLGEKLTLAGNVDNFVLKKANATVVGIVKTNSTEWYVQHYTPLNLQEALLSKQILSKVPQSFNM